MKIDGTKERDMAKEKHEESAETGHFPPIPFQLKQFSPSPPPSLPASLPPSLRSYLFVRRPEGGLLSAQWHFPSM